MSWAGFSLSFECGNYCQSGVARLIRSIRYLLLVCPVVIIFVMGIAEESIRVIRGSSHTRHSDLRGSSGSLTGHKEDRSLRGSRWEMTWLHMGQKRSELGSRLINGDA